MLFPLPAERRLHAVILPVCKETLNAATLPAECRLHAVILPACKETLSSCYSASHLQDKGRDNPCAEV